MRLILKEKNESLFEHWETKMLCNVKNTNSNLWKTKREGRRIICKLENENLPTRCKKYLCEIRKLWNISLWSFTWIYIWNLLDIPVEQTYVINSSFIFIRSSSASPDKYKSIQRDMLNVCSAIYATPVRNKPTERSFLFTEFSAGNPFDNRFLVLTRNDYT